MKIERRFIAVSIVALFFVALPVIVAASLGTETTIDASSFAQLLAVVAGLVGGFLVGRLATWVHGDEQPLKQLSVVGKILTEH